MDVPSQLLDLAKSNIVVQWLCVISVVLLIGTNTATKLKGPFGGIARWIRSIGDARGAREVEERRALRARMLQEAQEGREYVAQELSELRSKVDELLLDRDALAELVEVHLGWDYDRKQQLIELGVPVHQIPAAPPLRVARKKPQVSGQMEPHPLT
jgi:hypothetical protein